MANHGRGGLETAIGILLALIAGTATGGAKIYSKNKKRSQNEDELKDKIAKLESELFEIQTDLEKENNRLLPNIRNIQMFEKKKQELQAEIDKLQKQLDSL